MLRLVSQLFQTLTMLMLIHFRFPFSQHTLQSNRLLKPKTRRRRRHRYRKLPQRNDLGIIIKGRILRINIELTNILYLFNFLYPLLLTILNNNFLLLSLLSLFPLASRLCQKKKKVCVRKSKAKGETFSQKRF